MRCRVLSWNRNRGFFSYQEETATARGMQRQNIVVNRSCTGDGSTEAE